MKIEAQAATSPGSQHRGRGKELPHGREEKGNVQGDRN